MRGQTIVIVSPNVSLDMGGEALKAYQYVRHLVNSDVVPHLVVHQRSAAVARAAFPGLPMHVVHDDLLQKLVWRLTRSNDILSLIFNQRARRHIARVRRQAADTVVHYVSPVSPVLPRLAFRDACNVLGPLTGNIAYPPGFRSVEPRSAAARRLLHHSMQRLVKALLHDKRAFSRVLVSGGERTRRSLAWGGCAPATMVDVFDSGIDEAVLTQPPVIHEGRNPRFLTSCRLVHFKGVDLAIEALARTPDAELDIYGSGPEREALEALAARLGVSGRVRFKGWFAHDALMRALRSYRGFVLASLAEANGIVVQEAMGAGLPVIALDWGGPALLLDEKTGILIPPKDRESVVAGLAAAMTKLADDGVLAAEMGRAGRAMARDHFTWSQVAQSWMHAYGLEARPSGLEARGASDDLAPTDQKEAPRI